MSKGLSIAELEQRIRDHVNTPRLHGVLSSGKNWAQLCSSMDAIGDAELGIDAFLSSDFPTDPGGAYLAIYGVLQLLFVEQDATQAIRSIFDVKGPLPGPAKDVRDIRNWSIGHPTSTRDGASHFIARYSMSKEGFRLLSLQSGGESVYRSVNLRRLIHDQREVLAVVLEGVLDKLIHEEQTHRDMFKGERLVDLFPKDIGYHVSKVMEGALTDDEGRRTYASTNVRFLSEVVEKFFLRISERGRGQTFATDVVRDLRYPLLELRKFFEGGGSLTPEGARIFAFFVEHELKRLYDIAGEIDTEYASPPL